MSGIVEILSVGEGDTKLSFDKSNPVERERAKRIVTDMLRRGYAILVQVGGTDLEPLYRRAKEFDPETCEYVIAGGPEDAVDLSAEKPGAGDEAPHGRKADGSPRKRPGPQKGRPYGSRRVPADKARAVAVGRVAGG